MGVESGSLEPPEDHGGTAGKALHNSLYRQSLVLTRSGLKFCLCLFEMTQARTEARHSRFRSNQLCEVGLGQVASGQGHSCILKLCQVRLDKVVKELGVVDSSGTETGPTGQMVVVFLHVLKVYSAELENIRGPQCVA